MSKIVLDAVGGDHAPREVILGVKLALERGHARASELILVGPEAEVRAAAVAGGLPAEIAIVDAPDVLEDTDTPIEAILALRPDVLVKGADWKAEEIVGGHEVQARGGRVLRIGLVAGQSTTRLVARSRGDEAPARRTAAAPDAAERSRKQLRPSRRPSSSTR